jgi:hypothetical protein
MLLRPRTIAFAIAVAVLELVASCGGGSTPDPAPGPTVDAGRIAPGCFQGGTAPELQIGDGFSGADWNDPHVLKAGGQYWMHASSNLGFAPTPASPVQWELLLVICCSYDSSAPEPTPHSSLFTGTSSPVEDSARSSFLRL